MPGFEKGTIVRVPFPYTDKPARQHRPALVASDGVLGEAEGLLWVVMITSAENRPWPGDIAFGPAYRTMGLPAPSVIRPCKIATIEARHAAPLGKATPPVLEAVEEEIRRLLGRP